MKLFMLSAVSADPASFFGSGHRAQIGLTLLLSLLFALTITYGDVYAYEMIGTGLGNNPGAALTWLLANPSPTWNAVAIQIANAATEAPAWVAYLVLTPAAAVFLFARYPIARVAWMIYSLTCLLIAIATLGDGGDRKGCEGCLAVVFLCLFTHAGLFALNVVAVAVHRFFWSR